MAFKPEAIDRLTALLASKSNQEHDAASPCVFLVSPLLMIFLWYAVQQHIALIFLSRPMLNLCAC
jgi:hypothetical protein